MKDCFPVMAFKRDINIDYEVVREFGVVIKLVYPPFNVFNVISCKGQINTSQGLVSWIYSSWGLLVNQLEPRRCKDIGEIVAIFAGFVTAPKWVVYVEVPANYDVIRLKLVFKDLCGVGRLSSVYRVYCIIRGLGVEDNSTEMEISGMHRFEIFRLWT